jgi:hypothetical protein
MANNEPARPQTTAPAAPNHQDDAEHADIAPPSPEQLDERERGSSRVRKPMGPVAAPDQARDDEPSEPADVPPTEAPD